LSINKYVVRSTLVGALGGLLFGFNTAVTSGTTAGLTHAFGLSVRQLGITVSIALWGTVVGALAAGVPKGMALGRCFVLRQFSI
jgi:SP family arabinose:H+ symporter-like MFS transporter